MKKYILLLLVFCMALCPVISVNADDRLDEKEIQKAVDAKDTKLIKEYIYKDESNIIDKTIEATVKVDESNIIREINDKYMFGVQYEAGADTEYMVDENGNVLDDYVKVAEEMFDQPIVRWGGASSNKYNLINFMGPISERSMPRILDDIDYEKYNPDVNYNEPVSTRGARMGPVEFIKTVQVNNPDAAFLFCLSLDRAYPEDNANFVRFLLDDKDESEWGALRASYGIPDPVNLYGIELGNEMYFFKTPTPELEVSGTQWYIDTFKKHAEAINKYHDVKCIACINSNSTRGGFYEWNEPIIKELGADYPEFAFHLYYSGYEHAYNWKWVEDVKGIFTKYYGEDNDLKLAFTEHANWGSGSWLNRAHLHKALAVGQHFSWSLNEPKITLETYHAATGKGWAMFTRYNDTDNITSNIARMYKVYLDNIGDRVVSAIVESDDPIALKSSTAQNFSVLATPEGKKTLKLFLVNREPYVDINLNFEFLNNYTLVEEMVFTAPNAYSFPYDYDDAELTTTTTTPKNEKNFKSYHMPTKSLVVLTLESDKNLPQPDGAGDGDDASYSGEDLFGDIDAHWANAKINLLAENGVLKGNGQGFAPDRAITRAEFASMLYSAAKSTDETLGTTLYDGFADVKNTDWFCEPVSYAHRNGLIKSSGNFNPGGAVTMRDLTLALYLASNQPETDEISGYSWSKGLSAWDKKAFGFVINTGIINGFYEGNGFSPDGEITRAQAASAIFNYLFAQSQPETVETAFSDISENWAKKEIALLEEAGVANAQDGKFNPDGDMTLAQMSMWICKALEIPEETAPAKFNDVQPESEYFGAVTALYKNGYFRSDADNAYPENGVSFKEFAKIIYRLSGEKNSENREKYEKQFDKFAGIDDYEKTALAYMQESGLLKRIYENSGFSPENTVTRAQGAYIVSKLLGAN